MMLKYKNKKIKLVECNTFLSRLKGFMFKKKIDYAIMFKNCNSIHTFFMKSNIDVIMCNKDNKILYYCNNLGKNKIILPKKKVYIVYETPSNYFNIKVNEYMEVAK